MKRLVVASFMALAASVLVSDTASAQLGFGYPFSGYGFGLPYGQFGGTVRTPPYFAVNPPVYYGSRYSRPYGISPFPAAPAVNAPADYQGRPAARFYYPPAETAAPCCNPYISGKHDSKAEGKSLVVTAPKPITLGKVQTNPFVQSTDRLAKK